VLVKVNVLIKMIAILGVIEPCTCSYTRVLCFWYPHDGSTFENKLHGI